MKSKFGNKGMPSQRQLRVSELIKRKLADLILRMDFFDSNISTSSISISEVRCSPDLKVATAYVLSIGEHKTEDLVALLRVNTKELRFQLGKTLDLKYTPEIRFIEDISVDQMLRTERLLKDTKGSLNFED
jgi:ribosome-binding factor A|tara:strand:+ start:798 stop:1190 length:393 start_codon:yes stop_codon:yes gene_type:complete